VAESLTGWTSAQARGKPVGEVFHIINESSRKPTPSPVERVLREGVISALANHTLLVRRDGSELPIDDSAAPVRDEKGALLGVVLVFRDVSEKKKAERERERLLASEKAAREEAVLERQKLHALFEQTPVAICILEGPQHVFTFANPAYRLLVGGAELTGKPVSISGVAFDIDERKETKPGRTATSWRSAPTSSSTCSASSATTCAIRSRPS
jgi:PAS domain S-box-containing protein